VGEREENNKREPVELLVMLAGGIENFVKRGRRRDEGFLEKKGTREKDVFTE